MKCALIIPDVHRPFHSKRAWNVMLQIGQDLNAGRGPDEVILLGDYLDFFNLSMHGPRDPRVSITLKEEIDDGNKGLDEIDNLFPNAKKVFICGNHTERLERFLIQNANPFLEITDVKTLLGFGKRLRWQWVEYGPNQYHRILGSNVLARHEPLKSTPAQTVREAGSSLLYGHVHKTELAWKVNLDGTKLFAGCPGWLGNPKAPAAQYVKGIQNWEWGFTVLYLDQKNAPHPFFVRISDDFKAVFGGKLYQG